MIEAMTGTPIDEAVKQELNRRARARRDRIKKLEKARDELAIVFTRHIEETEGVFVEPSKWEFYTTDTDDRYFVEYPPSSEDGRELPIRYRFPVGSWRGVYRETRPEVEYANSLGCSWGVDYGGKVFPTLIDAIIHTRSVR